MCGIAGILTTRPDLDLEPALTRMRSALRHRGPDDEGCARVALPGGARLGLAHTRLSILDLSAAGRQPMEDPASGSWVVLNGEIYNYRELRRQLPDVPFRSTGDTEVLLAGWVRHGPAVLEKLRGMFAFGLYDGRRGQFWLVRDRLGVKPLYVSRVNAKTWIFASEVRALLASGWVERHLDREAVASYLAFGAVTAPRTLVRSVTSLLPGEAWRFDLGIGPAGLVPCRTRYWRPEFAARNASRLRRAEAIERLRPVLTEAVGLRMVADVPVGMFLSGGIDSSSVIACLAGHEPRPHTFTVAFQEHSHDESAYARLVARRFGTRHAELLLRPEQVVADFEPAVAAYDQPSLDGLNTYFLARAARQAGVKVVLSGLGGDELFAGYPYFRLLARLERGLTRRLAHCVHGAFRVLAPHSRRTAKLGALLRNHRLTVARYAVCREALNAARRAALFPAMSADTPDLLPREIRDDLDEQARGLDPVNAQSLLELSLYLANTLLRDADQMSMAHGLELREPLLDHRLVETVAALPGPLKLARGRASRTKALLVDALPAELPAEVFRRRKMGFSFPWERWLRGELRGPAESVLTDKAALLATGFDPAAVDRLWKDFLGHEPGVRATDVLGLVHLLYWLRRHQVRIA